MFERISSATLCIACAVALSACAAGAVKPEDRDTSGAYDGVWLARVGPPQSARAELGNNWRLRCGWEPFQVLFNVADGMVSTENSSDETPISKDGRFLYVLDSGAVRQVGGSAPGNNRIVTSLSGELSDEVPEGRYRQTISTFGGGCTAGITYIKVR